MGVVKSITHLSGPKQTLQLGKRAKVSFHYDAANAVMGTIVRDDAEAPWVRIFYLDDGRYILSTECQYMYEGG